MDFTNIKESAKKYNFDKIDIENTLNSGYWYQPYINDSEFIMNYLLPFAFSNSSQNTPFYCWIDSNNEFHFKSFQSMFFVDSPGLYCLCSANSTEKP